MRVAIGQLWQETNTFNPLPTTRGDFEAFGVLRGREVAGAAGEHAHSGSSGAKRERRDEQAQSHRPIVPSLAPGWTIEAGSARRIPPRGSGRASAAMASPCCRRR